MEAFTLFLTILALTPLMPGQFVYDVNAQLVDCQESDRQALVDFKKGLEDSENRLSSWQGLNCCQWWGIACSNRTRAVVAVDLHNPFPSNYDSSGRYGLWNLSGEIRPSLTKLKSLRYLDLSFNTFNGTIPNFFSSLKNLQYLNLSNAGFIGPIPPTIGNLSRLQLFDVTSYSPSLTVNSLEWMISLVSLKYLAMDGANLSMVGVGWVEALNKLPLLTELHLSGCGLSSFMSSLNSVNFTSLAVLDLSGNNLNSVIPNWLANISSLVSVDFYFSGLYGRIPLGFSELPNLQSLTLRDNENLSASCYQLFRGSWEKIEYIDLSMNKLHGRLPASMGNWTSLTFLNLFHNEVTGSIPSSFGKLCNLQYVDLSSNNMTGSLPEVLEEPQKCPSQSPLPSLQHLDASYNQLVGNLPNWLGQLQNLLVFNFQHNLLEGPIPASLGNLQNLSELRLEANKLNGTLPDSLGQLPELYALDVSINQLTGFLTDLHFSSLSKLQYLVLSANSFMFNVSSNWVPPFQVLYLDLGSCHLGPSFPTWLRSQKELEFLDVSNASISGNIPNWLWEMSGNLTLLNVSFNQLEGYIPNPFNIAPSAMISFQSNLFKGSLPLPSVGVHILDLSDNKFSGSIPNKISKVSPNLVFLSLSRNRLFGAIPMSLGEMLSLDVINLSGNNFTGSLPSSLGNCSSLVVLDLQHNNLSGVIPESFGQLNLLQTLHLSNNNLSGEIPSSFQNLKNLETLDLGNNRLIGNIPQWIGNGFGRLRILSLRSNLLFGELPNSLMNLSSLQVLDLADNQFNGTIPASIGDLKAMAHLQMVNRYLLYGLYMTSYYQENIDVDIKGALRKFTKTLSLLNSIDLSNNNFHGEIPEKITKLAGLEVLNLSGNYISGQIPQNISELHQLFSFDISNNRLWGPIPPSMSSMSFLEYLNLSNNNLSGRIPYTAQMSTFDASSFSGNLGLCGDPLLVKCPGDDSNDRRNGSHDGGTTDANNGDDFVDKWLYLSIGLGFAAGLLLPFLMFAIKRSWSQAYFSVVEKVVERLSKSYQKDSQKRRRI